MKQEYESLRRNFNLIPMATMKNIGKEILIAAKTGDLNAFEQILIYYEKPIFNYIYRIAKDKDDAKDITQLAFIKLYKNIKQIDPNKSFKSWLYKIATNTAYDWFRKQKSRKELLILSEINEEKIAAETNKTENTYNRHMNAEERMKDIDAALKQIKAVYRSCLLLFYYQEMTYQEIAQTLSLPINTVKTYLYRGKAELRAIMAEN